MKRKLVKGIRIARVIALAMIAVAEPISTALGVCILFALAGPGLVIRHQEARKRAYLRHIITEYTRTYRPFGYGIGYKPATSANLHYRFRKPLFNAGARSGVKDESYASRNITGEQPIVFHALNRNITSKQFEYKESRYRFEDNRNPRSAGKRRTPVYHYFNRISNAHTLDNSGSRSGLVGYWGQRSFVEIKRIGYRYDVQDTVKLRTSTRARGIVLIHQSLT